jgi:hypothetical protein
VVQGCIGLIPGAHFPVTAKPGVAVAKALALPGLYTTDDKSAGRR